MHRRPTTALVGLTALALALTGCTGSAATIDSEPAAAAPRVVPSAPAETPAAAEVTPAPSVEPTTTASASASVAPTKAPAKPSYDVAAVQTTLAGLGYYLGSADGKAGGALKSAVMAFQKVNGLGVDGAVGPSTLAALAAPKAPVLKAAGPADRVEVDLTKQVLYVVKGGAIQRILPVSSGNGATYEQKDGSKARALTPTGYYKIERRIVGERVADLGTLYDPQYFYRGWAIHGSNSVPAGPASHGCVRVTRADAKWLLGAINNGMSVYLYGGAHTFSAGSAAPGTDTPTGDGGAPAPTPPPAAPATPAPSPASPKPAPQPSSPPPTPTSPPPTTPSPTATASPSSSTEPSASPSESSTG